MELPNRTKVEVQLAREMGKLYSDIRDDLTRKLGKTPKLENIPLDWWDEIEKRTRGVLSSSLIETYMVAAEQQLGQSSIGVDWALVNERAADWASEHVSEISKQFVGNSRQAVSKLVESYYRNGLTLGDLEKQLSSIFGPIRAEMIAITEITAAASAGEIQVSKQITQDTGLQMMAIWKTNMDERVCPICGNLNSKKAVRNNPPQWESGGNYYDAPPAHPRCRCWMSLELPK